MLHFARRFAGAAILSAIVALACPAGAAELRSFFAPHPTEIALPSASGGTFSLQAVSAPTVLVHFFATWCEPCREEFPSLQRLSQRGGPELAVVAISVAEPDPRVMRFLSSVPVDFPVLLDRDRAAAKAWDVAALPMSFVLGPDRKARATAEGGFAWDAIDISELAHLADASRQQSVTTQ